MSRNFYETRDAAGRGRGARGGAGAGAPGRTGGGRAPRHLGRGTQRQAQAQAQGQGQAGASGGAGGGAGEALYRMGEGGYPITRGDAALFADFMTEHGSKNQVKIDLPAITSEQTARPVLRGGSWNVPPEAAALITIWPGALEATGGSVLSVARAGQRLYEMIKEDLRERRGEQ